LGFRGERTRDCGALRSTTCAGYPRTLSTRTQSYVCERRADYLRHCSLDRRRDPVWIFPSTGAELPPVCPLLRRATFAARVRPTLFGVLSQRAALAATCNCVATRLMIVS